MLLSLRLVSLVSVPSSHGLAFSRTVSLRCLSRWLGKHVALRRTLPQARSPLLFAGKKTAPHATRVEDSAAATSQPALASSRAVHQACQSFVSAAFMTRVMCQVFLNLGEERSCPAPLWMERSLYDAGKNPRQRTSNRKCSMTALLLYKGDLFRFSQKGLAGLKFHRLRSGFSRFSLSALFGWRWAQGFGTDQPAECKPDKTGLLLVSSARIQLPHSSGARTAYRGRCE